MGLCESCSLDDTFLFAKDFAKTLKPGDIIAFYGGLGSGKTTLIKELSSHLGAHRDHVSSPTFVYLQIYSGICPIYHFDLYRMEKSSDFISMGFEDYFDDAGICFIEWSERIEEILPERTRYISIEIHNETGRRIRWR